MTHHSWYIRHKERVRGPFPTARIARLLTLGHLHDGDDISPDGQAWHRLGALRQQFTGPTEDATPTQNGSGTNDIATLGDKPAARSKSTRHVPSGPGRQRAALRARYIANAKPGIGQAARQFAVIAGILAAILAAGIFSVSDRQPPQRACQARAVPGVNWNNCGLEGAWLSSEDLTGANMRSARLRGAELSSAKLQQADLAYSELAGANLHSSDLRQAKLVGANLQGAKLINADLQDADLAYADLTDADLRGANLRGARLAHAIWIDRRVCAPDSFGHCEQP